MEAYLFNPSGRRAKTVREFVEACKAEPHVASEHLRAGYFEPWLIDAGRRDLAHLASQIRMSGVSTIAGLEQFVRAAVAKRTPSRTK
jgi:hypothetical protein